MLNKLIIQENKNELVEFFKDKAVTATNYDDTYRYVQMVTELTSSTPNITIDTSGIIRPQKHTDVPLTHYYCNEARKEYHIQRLHSKEGHLICRGRPLKLNIPQIMQLKETIHDPHYVLDTPRDWIHLSKLYDINWMSLQRYAYNLDIGTFDKWIKKFLKKHECQTTLKEGE